MNHTEHTFRRFFVDPSSLDNRQAILEGSEARHLTTVLRAKKGMRVELFDGQGMVCQATVASIGRDRVVLEIDFTWKSETTLVRKELVLAMALCKGKTMDFLVQKATELGVHRLQPLTTRYSEAPPAGERLARQAARWQRIMLAACKQCRRSLPMTIDPLLDLADLDCHCFAHTLVLFEGEKSRSLHDVPWEAASSTCLIVGPEGGLHTEEVDHLARQGALALSLGPLILRAETAALAGLAIIQLFLGNLQSR